eukprot:SAG22_NODE_644_length_8212_cov_2.904474_1_plen_43_part_10
MRRTTTSLQPLMVQCPAHRLQLPVALWCCPLQFEMPMLDCAAV